jgi:hypothetical protein
MWQDNREVNTTAATDRTLAKESKSALNGYNALNPHKAIVLPNPLTV